MRVAVVNLFDPMPGESIKEARYSNFCRELVARGHDVRWYTADFSHLHMESRDRAAIEPALRDAGFSATFVPTQPYKHSASPQRLRSHVKVAATMEQLWRSEPDPDVILVSVPHSAVSRAASRWARRTGARLAVDVQDLWPETILRFWPRSLAWLNQVVFFKMIRDARATYRRADVIFGVCRECLDQARGHHGPATRFETLRLGVDLDRFDASVTPIDDIPRPDGEKWLFFGGSMSNYVDFEPVLDMMAVLRDRGRADIRLMVVGGGAAEDDIRDGVRQRGLDNVTMTGRQPYPRFVSLAAACDLGVLAMKPEGMAVFPNRIFDYFAAGLPVVSTVVAELAEYIDDHDAGITLPEPDGAALADAVTRLLADRPKPSSHPRDHRPDWVDEFDLSKIRIQLGELIESLA